jgi:hypothetical protein
MKPIRDSARTKVSGRITGSSQSWHCCLRARSIVLGVAAMSSKQLSCLKVKGVVSRPEALSLRWLGPLEASGVVSK